MERIKRLFRAGKPKVNLSEKPKQTSWRTEGCEIIFPLQGIEATPTSWMTRFEGAGNRISSWVKSILRHKKVKFDAQPLDFDVIFVRGIHFADDDRNCEYIGEYAKVNAYFEPDLYQSCLIAENINPKILVELGAEWVMLMHTPIINEEGKEKLFILYPFEEKKKGSATKQCLSLYNYRPEQKHTSGGLYAYVRQK